MGPKLIRVRALEPLGERLSLLNCCIVNKSIKQIYTFVWSNNGTLSSALLLYDTQTLVTCPLSVFLWSNENVFTNMLHQKGVKHSTHDLVYRPLL